MGNYLGGTKFKPVDIKHAAFQESETKITEMIKRFLSIKGKRTVDEFHIALGKILWDYVGMARNKAGLKKALEMIPKLREEFWRDMNVVGSGNELNAELEKAGRVADYFELSELMALDALHREESCGGHFREEYQTEEGEAKRNDKAFSYVAAWEYAGPKKKPILNKEPLKFEYVIPSQRSYK
jgi:succinate dehydrogenase / fumarate reductase flavoprotein subunit